MELYIVQLMLLAAAHCASGDEVTVYANEEMTITGRTHGSVPVTYKVYTLPASYKYASVFPSKDEFKNVEQIGTNPTFVADKTTKELLCFGFHADSCDSYKNSKYDYRVYTIFFDELIYSLYFYTNAQGQLAGVLGNYEALNFRTFRVFVGGIRTNSVKTYKLETSTRPLVGVIYDAGKLKFLFSKNSVTTLGDYFTPIFDDVLVTAKRDISELQKFKQKYTENPMKEVAEKSCAYTASVYGTGVNSCLYSYLMQYIIIMGDDLEHLKNHQPRNLVNTSDYNTAKYAAEVEQGKKFREVLNEIEIVKGKVVRLANKAGDYFVSAASFDAEIANQDKIFLRGELTRLSKGTGDLVNNLSKRLSRLLKNAMILTGLDLTDLMVRLALAVGENLNPLKHIFGGTDISTMAGLASDISDAARQFGQSVRLLKYAEEFINSAYNIGKGFSNNHIDIKLLERIVTVSSDADDKELKEFASYYVSKYGGYSPKVTSQSITKMIGLLETVVDKACELYYESGGVITGGTGTAFDQKEDCIHLPGMVEELMSYYDETFEFQFSLIDALTGIVRGAIAVNLAGKFKDITGKSEFDIKLAALGTAMLELKSHQIVRKHCDWLEYRYGGKRIDECRNFFFDDLAIDKILANDEGDIVKNYEEKWAYIPTIKQSQDGYPSINISQLIATGKAMFRLPIELDKQQFLKDNFWLPGNYRGSGYNYEKSYFVKKIEAYIPGLTCTGTTNVDKKWIEIKMVSGEMNRLFPEEAPPQYFLPPAHFSFKYDRESGCAGEPKGFRVKYGSTTTTHNLCIRSAGTYHGKFDKLIPSIYAPWTMIIGKHPDCILRQTLADPMITFRVEFKEVHMTGIDECWPEGRRCDSQRCINGVLSYSCQ